MVIQPYPDGISGRRTTAISALEHGIPVVTTLGELSEAYWAAEGGVATVGVGEPARAAEAVERLLQPPVNAAARAAAFRLYQSRFAPSVSLAPVFE